MAANPPLYEGYDPRGGRPPLLPAPFPGERVVLRRSSAGLELRGELRDVKGRPRVWKAGGSLVLTDVRLVFVADKASPEGLRAFDFPLAYLRGDVYKFNQPIFGANNIAMECFRVGPSGGPGGSSAPLSLKVRFTSGGAGTFLPLFWGLMQYVQERAGSVTQAPIVPVAPAAPAAPTPKPEDLVQTAFVDPNDPSFVYLVEPDPPPPGTARPEPDPAYDISLPAAPSNGATFAPTNFQRG